MTRDSVPGSAEVGRQMVSGAIWMIAMRWTFRLLGLVSTVILVRILAPEDFGLMAMAYVFVGLVTTSLDLSVDQAILREVDDTREHYDAAWSIQVGIGIAASILIALLAPAVAWYFRDPRLDTVLLILCFQPLIAGFENVGIIKFRKDLAFDREFKFWTAKKMLSVMSTIGLALYFDNYLGLAAGAVAAAVASVLLSYVMSPYRPRFSTTLIKKLWSFSRWMVLTNSALFGAQKADGLVVGRLGGANWMGLYAVSSDVSFMPVQEIFMPLDRALLPTYAHLLDRRAALYATFKNVIALSLVVLIATGTGLVLVAEDLVAVILGDQWSGGVPTFKWLAVAGCFFGLILVLKDMQTTLRKERLFAITHVLHLIVLVAGALTVAIAYGVEAVAIARAGIAGAFAALTLAQVYAVIGGGLRETAKIVWRPAIAAAAMAIAVTSLHGTISNHNILSLLFDTAVGVFLFTGSLFGLWSVVGAPAGPEQSIWHWVRNRHFDASVIAGSATP